MRDGSGSRHAASLKTAYGHGRRAWARWRAYCRARYDEDALHRHEVKLGTYGLIALTVVLIALSLSAGQLSFGISLTVVGLLVFVPNAINLRRRQGLPVPRLPRQLERMCAWVNRFTWGSDDEPKT